ncbi:MAG: hypothetical protein R2710_24395 [Acidimicrobiales bacterium]
MNAPAGGSAPSPYMTFTAEQWADLRAATPLSLDETDLERLRGINVELSLDEVASIMLPLSRLLNLYVGASQELYRASDTFLGQLPAKVPFVIGIAGSVAVGKSTTARVLQALLGRWPDHPKVDLITTDGFLYPNAVLNERGLMERKGSPRATTGDACCSSCPTSNRANPRSRRRCTHISPTTSSTTSTSRCVSPTSSSWKG